MKKSGCAVLAAFITLSIVFTALPEVFLLRADAVSASDIKSEADSVLESEVKRAGAKDIQQMLDGFAANPGAHYTFAFTLIQYKGNSLNYSKYADSLKSFSSSSPTTRLFLALIFAALNTNKSYIEKSLKNDIGELGIMSYIYGLHLISNCRENPYSHAKKYIKNLIDMQLEDGGWALSGSKSTVDVTAMAIQALAHFKSDAAVNKAIESALSALSKMQQNDAGFIDSGHKNPESAAQVTVALTSLGINPLTDSAFIKNGKSAVDSMLSFRLKDGGFTHDDGEYNSMATVQALYSLISIYRMQNGKGALYDIETDIKLSDTAQDGKIYITPTTAKATTRADITAPSTTRSVTQTAAQTTAVYSSYSRRTTTVKTKSDKSTSSASSAKNRENLSMPEESATAAPSSAVGTTQPKTERDTSKASLSETAAHSKEETTAEYLNPVPDIGENEAQTALTDTKTADDPAASETVKDDDTGLPKIKIYLISGVWALALAGAAVLIIKKNKKALNYIIIVAVAAAGTAGILFGDIKTPDEYYKTPELNAAETVTVTMSITCETVAGEGDEAITPSDGIILPETEFTLGDGSTVYDCLIYAAKKYKIQIEDNTQTLSDHSRAYIAGINYLYEFDYGNLSGWMYSVNGEFADRGCGEYTLTDGDSIKWQYTRNIGDDLK